MGIPVAFNFFTLLCSHYATFTSPNVINSTSDGQPDYVQNFATTHRKNFPPPQRINNFIIIVFASYTTIQPPAKHMKPIDSFIRCPRRWKQKLG